MRASTSSPAAQTAAATAPHRRSIQLRTRMLISTVAIIVLTVALAAVVLVERVSLNREIDSLSAMQSATDRAGELSLRIQQDSHVLSAYALGHVEHRPEFDEQAAAFVASTEVLQRAIDAGVLDEDEQESLDSIRATHETYLRAGQALFAAVDAASSAPSAAAAAAQESAWQEAGALSQQLDDDAHTLSSRIAQDVARRQAGLDQRNQLMIGVVLGLSLLVCAMIVLTHIGTGIALGRPLDELLAGIKRFARGDSAVQVRVHDEDEIGSISAAFNTMASRIHEQSQSLVRLDVAEAARAEAEAARLAIAEQLATIERQQAQIRQMSVPVLPVSSSALVLPLVGVVDESRLAALQHEALRAVERRGARFLILDVTGVPLIDGAVANGLLRTVQATRLLGADVVLVGIRPEVAQSLVHFGGSLEGVKTRSTLQSGIQYVLERESLSAAGAPQPS